MKGMVSNIVKKMLHTVGVGRHSDEEVKNMMTHDMKMLSELLGMFFRHLSSGVDPGFLERVFICIHVWGFALLILSHFS